MEKPDPTVREVPYGLHARHVLDVWTAVGPTPAPLVLFIHGGGFVSDSKEIIWAELIHALREIGCAVAAINYRYCGPGLPLPGPMLDAARALQFLRATAARWNIDPKRIGLCGGSAGATAALWLACRKDLEEPKSPDPIARQSTRVSCAFVWDAQTSYDPRFVRLNVGGDVDRHELLPVLFQLPPEQFYSAEAFKLYREISPIEHVSAGCPPMFLYYSDPAVPLLPDDEPSRIGHHPSFGPPFRRQVESVGGLCVLRHKTDYRNEHETMIQDMKAFLQQNLR